MENQDKLRLSKINNEVNKKVKQKIEEIQAKAVKFERKVKEVGLKITNYIKDKCAEEYKWYELNTIIKIEDGIEKLEVKEEAKVNSEDKIKRLETCIALNDFGMGSVVNTLELKSRELEEETYQKQSVCVSQLNKLTDDDIENCLEKCFNDLYSQTNTLINDAYKEIVLINKNI